MKSLAAPEKQAVQEDAVGGDLYCAQVEELASRHRTKVVDVELSSELVTLEGLDGYQALQGLVRMHGAPVGYVNLSVASGRCTAESLTQAILHQHGRTLMKLAAPCQSDMFEISDLANVPCPVYEGPFPLVTVAVCTRNNATDLAQCLDSLRSLDYPALDILVVDNAPSNDDTEHLVRRYANVRYIREPRPGLDWARNLAILEARGGILAFTDDDVVVDSGWVRALVAAFSKDTSVMAVTGLVVPLELETEAQMLFERYGGFGTGFERKCYQVDHEDRCTTPIYVHAIEFSTGANMAYRRCVFDQIGSFDPALDAGTTTNGGGDLAMFFGVLKAGHTLVYEPGAVVRHRHRRELAQLRTQITSWGTGFIAGLISCALTHADERSALTVTGLRWFSQQVRRLLVSVFSPPPFPRDLILAELRGALLAPHRYWKARRTAAQIANVFGLPAQSRGPGDRSDPASST